MIQIDDDVTPDKGVQRVKVKFTRSSVLYDESLLSSIIDIALDGLRYRRLMIYQLSTNNISFF